eukprot:2659206-Amphidinium_carterae.1
MTTRALGGRSLGSSQELLLSPELRNSLMWSLDLMSHSIGREIPLKRLERQVAIFTDGAVEGEESERCWSGGVAVFPHRQPEYFALEVPSELVNMWKAEGRKHVIFHTELLPVLVAQFLWSRDLENQLSLFFVDNEAARCALVASQTGLSEAMKILWESLRLVASHRMRPWYARVPSSCNIADAPSRHAYKEVEQRWGAIRVPTPDFASR